MERRMERTTRMETRFAKAAIRDDSEASSAPPSNTEALHSRSAYTSRRSYGGFLPDFRIGRRVV